MFYAIVIVLFILIIDNYAIIRRFGESSAGSIACLVNIHFTLILQNPYITLFWFNIISNIDVTAIFYVVYKEGIIKLLLKAVFQ